MPPFSSGFRCFFLGAAVFAPVAVSLWVVRLADGRSALSHLGSAWHAHEMLFGYTLAVFSGFLTIRLSGGRLAFLFGLWAAARIFLALPGASAQLAGMLIDLSFIPALIALREPALWSVRKWPNGVFLPLLIGFWLANLGFHLGAGTSAFVIGAGLRDTALDLFALLLVAIGGRLVPGYTGATLTHIRPPRRPMLEFGSIAALLFAAGLHAADLAAAAGSFLLIAAVLEAIRLTTWRPWETRHTPLLWILHLGYGWLVLGLVMRGAADLWPLMLAPSAALHAFAVGAIGSLTIGMMTRLTLVHTRSALAADQPTVAAFLLMQAAAVSRVAGPLMLPDLMSASYMAAATFWGAAFVVWIQRHIPRLIGSESQPGNPSTRGRVKIGQ